MRSDAPVFYHPTAVYPGVSPTLAKAVGCVFHSSLVTFHGISPCIIGVAQLQEGARHWNPLFIRHSSTRIII